jgi:hypothetical protein
MNNLFLPSLSVQGEEIFLDMFEDEYRSMTVSKGLEHTWLAHPRRTLPDLGL